MLGGVAGLLAWYELREWQWMAGGFFPLANWPFTILVIMPTNRRLLAMQPRNAGAESRRLLLRWGHDLAVVGIDGECDMVYPT
jgi:hypothetical protein